MPKVIQVRDVPDEVHAALVSSAKARGLSLAAFLNAELSHLAARSAVAAHNDEVIRRTRAQVGPVGRSVILAALDETRAGV